MTDKYDDQAEQIVSYNLISEGSGDALAKSIAHNLREIGQERDKYKAEADHFKAQCSYMNTQINNSARPASEVESERDSLKAKLDMLVEKCAFVISPKVDLNNQIQIPKCSSRPKRSNRENSGGEVKRKSKDSTDKFYDAVIKFLKANGWMPAVIGGVQVRQQPSPMFKYNYELVINFFGVKIEPAEEGK